MKLRRLQHTGGRIQTGDDTMFICEPSAIFAERQVRRIHAARDLLTAPLADKTGWDQAIMFTLQRSSGEPILLVRLVNMVVKDCRHSSTRHRDAMRVDILKALGSLVRRGRIVRLKRRFVLLPR